MTISHAEAPLGRSLGAVRRRERLMAMRKISPTGRSFMLPLLWVVLLLVTYVVLSQWEALPSIFTSMKAGFFHWSV